MAFLELVTVAWMGNNLGRKMTKERKAYDGRWGSREMLRERMREEEMLREREAVFNILAALSSSL